MKVACPVCGQRPRRTRHDWLFSCGDCGLLSSSLEPAIPTTAETSVIDEENRRKGLEATRSRNNAIILDRLEAMFDGTNDDRKILDVGCGHGHFLADAEIKGFSAVGIEPDANVAPLAASRGFEVRQGFFPDVLERTDTFDVVIFNDVLEHIPEVEAAIAASRDHLSPGGLLVLNAPDQRGFFYRVGRALDRLGISGPIERLWQVGLPSPHVWYFAPKHLVSLGQSAGFRCLASFTLSPIARQGLAARIFYVKKQSKLLGLMTFAATWLILPAIEILPKDICVVFLVRSEESEQA